jgi:hypothetical protein
MGCLFANSRKRSDLTCLAPGFTAQSVYVRKSGLFFLSTQEAARNLVEGESLFHCRLGLRLSLGHQIRL